MLILLQVTATAFLLGILAAILGMSVEILFDLQWETKENTRKVVIWLLAGGTIPFVVILVVSVICKLWGVL